MLNVLIADDHKIFRESLRYMLELDPDIRVVAMVGDGIGLLERASQTKPDVVCMDIMMPGINGIEATRRLVASQPDIKIIGLAASPDPRYILEMINAGASGYITKNEAPEELQVAIRNVCANRLYFCPEVSSSVFETGPQHTPDEPPHSLSLIPGSEELRLFLTDITRLASTSPAQEEASDEFLRLRQIVEGSPIASFAIDQAHVVTHWNKACEVLTGIPASRVTGTREHWRAFYPTERPLMADLILEGSSEDELARYYGSKVRRSTLIEGAYEAEDFFPNLGKDGAWVFFTATPLYDAQRRLIGTLETLQDFTARHNAETTLQEREAHYRQLSITDNLTELFNSRHFYNQLRAEIGRAIRYAHPLSLVVMDVDNFKQYNDSYGHPAGDAVLQELANVIRHCIRLGDSGYRIGGEEFAILLPETDLENAHQMAERLRMTFATVSFSPLANLTIRSSVSIGVTRYRAYEKNTTLIRRADTACYQAKHQGKNRVVVS